jgi:large conductance mechanosensitive channel
MWTEFKGFLVTTNAMALAIAVIIGAALGAVVNALVNDIIMPPIGLALGHVDFSQLKWVLQAATDPADPTTEVAIRYGAFINALIAFVIIAFVVWRLSKVFIHEEPAPEPALIEPPTKICPFCREANAIEATRCRACTSNI